MKALADARLLLLAAVLSVAGCRLPATRTVSIQTGQQCWSQVHLVCQLEAPPSASFWPGSGSLWRFPFAASRPEENRRLQVELIYPHPEKGPQWALALLHREPAPAGEKGARASLPARDTPKPSLAISREELERLLFVLDKQPGGESSPESEKSASTACLRGAVDGQALFLPRVPAEPWLALARRLQRRGRWYRGGTWPALQAFGPSQLVRAYRRTQLAELPLPLGVMPARKKTAQVFRLPGLK